MRGGISISDRVRMRPGRKAAHFVSRGHFERRSRYRTEQAENEVGAHLNPRALGQDSQGARGAENLTMNESPMESQKEVGDRSLRVAESVEPSD